MQSIDAAPVQAVGAIRILFGGASAPDSEQLHLSRLPRRLANGGYVASNSRSELLWLAPDGHLLRKVGRRGSGPGEFESPWAYVVLSGDTVWALDPPRRGLSRFDGAGRYLGLERINFAAGFAAATRTGAIFIVDGWSTRRVFQGGRVIRGDYTDTSWVLMRQRGADTNTPLFRIVGYRNWVGDDTWEEVHYAGDPYLAATEHEIVLAHGATRTLTFWSFTGQHRASLQLTLPRNAVSAEMQQQVRDSLLQAYPNFDRQRLAAQHFADSTPLLDRLLVDATGCVWIRQWAPMRAVQHTWLAFRIPSLGGSITATPIARMTIPSRLRVSDIGRDDVLGIDVDEDGVQAIALAPLTRTVSCYDGASSTGRR